MLIKLIKDTRTSILFYHIESKGEFVDVKITNRNKTPFPKFIELVLSNEQKVFRINLWKNEDLSDKIPVKIDGIDKNGQNDYNPDVEHYIGNTYNAVVSIRNLKDNKEIMGSFDNYGKTYEIRPIDSSDKHNDDNKNHIIQEIDKEILNSIIKYHLDINLSMSQKEIQD
ncbi:hypothetical protein A3Q56_06463 [Intoshia linei]|uniref:Uncharacterized protein n=1 Tax=Intoshia linei TaxID=1819745 RepID=A0A177AUY8_9BILA|nr:hypothetical protein A3Q56_06463 [Intoshia linei]